VIGREDGQGGERNTGADVRDLTAGLGIGLGNEVDPALILVE
jgi:hypothetical protein